MTSGPWSWRSFSTLGANCLPLPSWYIWDGAKWSDGGGTAGYGRCGWPGFAWYRIHWHFFCMRREGYSFLPGYSWWLQNLGIKWATFQAEWVRVGVIHNRVNRVCIYTRTHTLLHRKDDSQKIACLFGCTTLGLAELLESPLVCILELRIAFSL